MHKKSKKVNFEIINFEKIDSTNDRAAEMVENEENFCNKVIFSKYQTKGRGAGSNNWQSEKNKNLLFSIIICPEIEVQKQFYISKVTSLAIIDYLSQNGIEAKIKWPNDTLVNQKKIAGILIENSIMGQSIHSSIIGVGFNINQKSFSDELNATSLAIEKGTKFDLIKELNSFLTVFEKRFNLCKNKNLDLLDKQYLKNLYGTDKYLKYRDKESEFKAIVEGIDNFGRLKLKDTTGKERLYMFKEAEMINY